MNGIGGTFKWSTDQIGAYAAAFREGDAVKVKGDWHEVKRVENTNTISISKVAPEDNLYSLNYRPDGEECYKGVAKGFLESRVDSPYEIVSPKDHRVQEGDKIVWLRDTVKQGCRNELTFGKAYDVFRSDDGYLVYKNDMAIELLASYLKGKCGMWGVIPRYENVKEKKDMDDKNEHSENTRTFKVGDVVKVSEEKSPEQEALEYLLSREKDATRRILQGEIAIWAKIHLEHGDYDDLRQATDILEKLEESEQD